LLKVSLIFTAPTQNLHPIFSYPEKIIAYEKMKPHRAEQLRIRKCGTWKGKEKRGTRKGKGTCTHTKKEK
jgi:hypothetical protein